MSLAFYLLLVACPLIAAQETLKAGYWGLDRPNPLQYFNGVNETGFEPLLAEELANAAGVDFQVVRLPTLPERFTALNESKVDLVIGAISVTPDRAKIVDFVKPYYYSSRAGLYAPGGKIQGVSNWTDLKGKTITSFEGYYANDEVASYGAQIALVNDTKTAANKVKSGEAVALLTDTGYDYSNLGLSPVTTPAPILPLPYAIAVRKGNTALATRLGNALMKLVEGGQSAPILAIEKETFGAEGFPPNKDLADLVANPTGSTLLNPK